MSLFGPLWSYREKGNIKNIGKNSWDFDKIEKIAFFRFLNFFCETDSVGYGKFIWVFFDTFTNVRTCG